MILAGCGKTGVADSCKWRLESWRLQSDELGSVSTWRQLKRPHPPKPRLERRPCWASVLASRIIRGAGGSITRRGFRDRVRWDMAQPSQTRFPLRSATRWGIQLSYPPEWVWQALIGARSARPAEVARVESGSFVLRSMGEKASLKPMTWRPERVCLTPSRPNWRRCIVLGFLLNRDPTPALSLRRWSRRLHAPSPGDGRFCDSRVQPWQAKHK